MLGVDEAPEGLKCSLKKSLYVLIIFFKEKNVLSPTAESFGVSAKLGPGALWGSHPARFRGSK